MTVSLSLKGLMHLARAGLVGFMALLLVGALMVAAERKKQDEAGGPADVEAVTTDSDAAAGGGDDPTTEKKESGAGQVIQMAILGAFVGMFSLLLLLLFPVGPTSKIFLGLLCGPVVPTLFTLPNRPGPDDLGGAILLGALVGMMVGLLEANRLITNRRRERREGAL